MYVVKIFQIPWCTKRRSLSLVKLKTSPAFLKMNFTTDIYFEFSKIFRTATSRGRSCLNTSEEIPAYWCDWFYFPVKPIWHSKECFSAKFLVKRWTKTPCTACLKKDTIPLYAYRQFVMYRILSKDERDAVYSLKNDKTIIMKEADEGSAVVFWDR